MAENDKKIPVPEKRITDFENLGFGMFIHWGLYSQLGKGEWIQCFEKQPWEEYKKLADTFTAEDFDARAIARLAKQAGMKYITLTTRHHEGFSLYDTCGLSDFDAPHSAAKRDLVREFVDGCRAEGIIPFFYHTTLDWYQDSFENDFDAYLEYLRKSVEVLCTNYGEIGGLWFDGNWSKPDADWKLDDLYSTIRKHQPNAMIINNTGLSARGELGHPEIDSVTFEQGLPKPIDRTGMSKYIAGEMCCTMNDHWGNGEFDFNFRSPAELIKTLAKCRKAGANFLLNVGPEGQGKIPGIMAETLKIVGRWADMYKDIIYTGKPYPIVCTGDDFALQTPDGKIYLFVFDLGIEGDENVTVSAQTDATKLRSYAGIDREIKSVKWLDNGLELPFIQDVEKQMMTVRMTGFAYGKNLIVRVAELTE